MVRKLVAIALLVTLVSAAPQDWLRRDGLARTEDILRFEPLVGIELVWEAYKSEHGKEYAHSTEEAIRMRIFAENLKKIEMHNYLYSKGLTSYAMGVNQYTDMEHSEFVKKLTGFKSSNLKKFSAATYLPPNIDFTLAPSVDWREKGYVTPVKDQGDCGSCWAFSTTGSLEGQHFRKTGKLVSLSEQNLLDCDHVDQACHGGLMDAAFEFIKSNGGIDTEESYPYEAKNGTCRYDPAKKGAEVTGVVKVPYDEASERPLTEAIATVGPISIGIDAGHPNFQHYKSGVFDEPSCSKEINHGVLAVGYGTLDGKDYYIVKNSWGSTWGDKGYILMSRNKKAQCGVGTYAVYPLV